MEDVDEGFGSNESNHSNHHKETIINDLKNLNGQGVLDKNTNGKNIFNGNMLENCSKKVEECLDMNDASENDLDLRKDNSNSTSSKCIGFANAFRGENCEEKVDKTKSDESCYSKLSEDTLSPANHCALKDNGSEKSDSKSQTHDESQESEVPSKCDDNVDKTINDIDSKNLNTDLPKINDINGDLKTDEPDNELEKSCLDKVQNNEANPLNRTPLKQGTSSAEGAKSPFLLDDKVRNSLKGLVAKVKSSELSRGSMSPTGSSVSGDGESQATLDKLQEVNSSDDISVEDEDTEDHNNREEDDVNDLLDNSDENILDDDEEEGISMEIGSENEDDLLEVSTEHSDVKMCNNKMTETAILDKTLENCNNQPALKVTTAVKEDTNSSSAVEIEITSDNEDDSVQDSDKEYKFKRDSVEKIQFEEDSNSNGNSGKINDIVNFLNRDLSGTNSPLLLSDNVVNDESKLKTVNNVLNETDTNNVENKDDNVIEMDEVHDNEEPDNDSNSEMQIEEDTVPKDRLTDDLGEKVKCMKSIVKEEDGPSLGEPHDVKQNFKGKEFENDENTAKDNEKAILESKEENNSGQMAELVSEKKVQESEVDDDGGDDDDVIFEGATMPSMRNKYQRLPVSGSGDEKSATVLKYSSGETNTRIDAINESKDETVSKEDDDVIFEKETKAEDNKSKQNCDIEKTSNLTNDVNESIQTIDSSPKLGNTNNNNSEEVHSAEKVSVIYSRTSSDRKRSAEDKEFDETVSKRSRLDLTGLIGKLGSRVEPASIELSDDEEEERNKPMEAETVTIVDKNEKKKLEETEKLITVTEKELEDLVREKVKLYLTSQRDTLVAKLSQKVKELQQNNDLWKRQVKDLQVKVNDVTVLQQKLEKRKAATAALRQITTRNVSVQVDEGRTASSKGSKMSATPPRAQMPLVTPPGGNGTIRLPIPQSSIAPPVLSTHLAQGSKMVTTTYQTPSVKSLLDTTRVQKTVGSLPSATTTTVNTSVFGLLQYPTTFMPKAATSQGLVQQFVTQVTTQTTSNVSKSVSATKTVTLPSPNAAKVIDLTDDDDSTKARLVTLAPGLNTVTNQQGVRHVLAPPGTQLVRTGLPNQPTYQLVFSSPPAVRPGMLMTVASTMPQTTTILQSVGQSQTLVNLSSPTAVAPGTTLARAAVPATPITTKPPITHPAPFPTLPPKQQTVGLKGLPPKPSLKISRVSQGIVLSWNMSLNETFAEISNYQLFAYQETSAQPVSTLWKKVGDVKALPLPMACTLTQFQVGNKYHFAVRAMDTNNRVGSFSDPGSIHLTPNTPTK